MLLLLFIYDILVFITHFLVTYLIIFFMHHINTVKRFYIYILIFHIIPKILFIFLVWLYFLICPYITIIYMCLLLLVVLVIEYSVKFYLNYNKNVDTYAPGCIIMFNSLNVERCRWYSLSDTFAGWCSNEFNMAVHNKNYELNPKNFRILTRKHVFTLSGDFLWYRKINEYHELYSGYNKSIEVFNNYYMPIKMFGLMYEKFNKPFKILCYFLDLRI